MSKHLMVEPWRKERKVVIEFKNGVKWNKRIRGGKPEHSVCCECGGDTQNEEGICSFCLTK